MIIKNLICLLFLLWIIMAFPGCGKHPTPGSTAIILPSAQSLGGEVLVVSFSGSLEEAYAHDIETLEVTLENGKYDLITVLLKDNAPIACFLTPVTLQGGVLELDVNMTKEACNDNYLGIHIAPHFNGNNPDLNNN